MTLIRNYGYHFILKKFSASLTPHCSSAFLLLIRINYFGATAAWSISVDPAAGGDKLFPLRVDADDVGTGRADVTVGAEREARREPPLVAVETFERRHESLTAHVSAAALEALGQDLRGGQRGKLRGRVAQLELVLRGERAQLGGAHLRHVRGDGREGEEDFFFEARGDGRDQLAPRQRAEQKE